MKPVRKKVLLIATVTALLLGLNLVYGWVSFGSDPTFTGSPVLNTDKKIYLPNENPRFSLGFINKPSQAWFDGRNALAAESIQTRVLYNGNAVDIPVRVSQGQSGAQLTIIPKGPIKPGKYTLQTTVRTDKGLLTSSQNFAWGVLAVNTNKAIYLPNENALIQMAVLSSSGHTICNAPLSLTVTDPSGHQTKPTVEQSGECQGDTYVSKPDYTATYTTKAPGRYKMFLRLADSDYSLTDYFTVKDNVPFDITRGGPTRIYPPSAYPMSFTIHANQNFSGTVTENLPSSFNVTPKDGGQLSKHASQQIISWQVNWRVGGDYKLGYQFRAPLVSPAFYFTGPLKLTTSDGQIVFQEERQWQIAGDAIAFVKELVDYSDATSSNSISLTVPSGGVPAGDTLIVTVEYETGTGSISSVSDSSSNTYTVDATGRFNGSGNKTAISICSAYMTTALSSGDTITINFAASYNHKAAWVTEFSGLASSSFVDQTANNNGTNANTVDSGTTATTTQADELLFASFGVATTGSQTLVPESSPISYTALSSKVYGGSEYAIVSSTGTYNATGDFNSANHWAGAIVTYKQAASSCSSPTTEDLMRHGNYFCSGSEQGFFWAN